MKIKDQKLIAQTIKELVDNGLIQEFIAYEVVYGVYTHPEGHLVDGVTIYMEVVINEEIKPFNTPMVQDIHKALTILKEFVKDVHKYDKLLGTPSEEITEIKAKQDKPKKASLQDRLKEAIAKEEYEEAAKIQKKIDKKDKK